MIQQVDAVVLAGTKNYPKMKYAGGAEFKPFIPILGKTLVEYVIEAALDSERVRRVYVVTDAERLEEILDGRGFSDERLKILPDQGGLIENIRFGVSREVLVDSGFKPFDYANMRRERYLENNPSAADHEVLLLFSDAPFIIGEDITRFIDMSDRTADYVVGLAEADALFKAEQDAGEDLCCTELKTALFPFDTTYVRGNNMFLGKPLKVPSQIWNLAQKLYDNRHLLKPIKPKKIDLEAKTGQDDPPETECAEEEENPDRWKNIVKLFWDYTRSNSNKGAVVRGFADGLFRFWQFRRARRKDSIGARLCLAKQDFERAGYDITGRTVRGSVNITDVVLPTFDVDNEEMLNKLTADDCSLFRKLREAPRHYHDNPEKELEEFVETHSDLFPNNGSPPREVPLEEWNRILKSRFNR